VTVSRLTKEGREVTLERTLKAFIEFCRVRFRSLRLSGPRCSGLSLVAPGRTPRRLHQDRPPSGKTETLTLLLRFLIIFHALLTGNPLMAGVASPKGEQAKTDIDRVKKSVTANS